MKNKGGIFVKVLIIIVVIVLIIALGAFIYINSILSNVNKQDINKSDLSVNTDIYEDVKKENENVEKKDIENVINIALFGSDSRDVNSMESGRSDTIIIASLNPKTKSIKLISIPRDTYVDVPGYGKTKINHAYAYGKEQLSIKTINSNFGLNITEYITIDFSGLVNVINKVGGINLTITEEERQYINKSSQVKVQNSGTVTLDGEQALIHSRNRTVGNDFTRAGRQRNVLEALLNKMSQSDVNQLLGLANEFLKEVKTNINITDYVGTLTTVMLNKNEYLKNVISIQIPTVDYAQGKMIDGIYYFVSDMEKSKQDMYTYLYEK